MVNGSNSLDEIMKSAQNKLRGGNMITYDDLLKDGKKTYSNLLEKGKQAYDEEGIVGVVNQTGKGLDNRVKAGTIGTIRNIGSKSLWFSGASVIVLALVVSILYIWNPYGVSDAFPIASNIGVLVILAFVILGYNWIGNTTDCGKSNCSFPGEKERSVFGYLRRVFIIMVILFIGFTLIVLIAATIASLSSGMWVFKRTLMAAIIFGGLTTVYAASSVLRKAVNEPIDPPSITKLVAHIVFYVPCLLYDFVNMIKEEYDFQEDATIIVLKCEALLIILWFLVPIVLDFILNYDGSLILNKPIYLNTSQSHGDMWQLYRAVKQDGEYVFDKAKRYEYSLSAWFRINPQPPNMKGAFQENARIISFGGRPRVTYNNQTQRMRVTCDLSEDNTVLIYETDEMPLQSWNNIVINYDGATMSVFLNGVLVGSRINIAPYIRYDVVETGQEHGLEGGITTVQFRNRTLSPGEVSLAYKTLGTQDTPSL